MIIKLKRKADKREVDSLIRELEKKGLKINYSEGQSATILGLIGDTSKLDIGMIRANSVVDQAMRIEEPYKKANRKFHPDDTVIELENGIKIGGGNFVIIAGPCAVENEDQVLTIARSVKEAGAQVLRGGAFKPRTSPYSFQGLGREGIKLLLKAKKETGLPIATEIMAPSQLKYFEDVDIIQVGARNMQNFELLKILGQVDKPILLKRGLSASYQELLMSAEYIMSEGNSKVILCERGIRTFENETRNTLDLTAVPFLHRASHLPVIVDPSHGTGIRDFVKPMSMAGTACGADGLMIEVHNDPEKALSDGPQSLRPDQFKDTVLAVEKIRKNL